MENNTITRQDHYLNELSHWLCLSDDMKIRHHSKEYDLMVRSKENETPVLYTFPFPEEKELRFNELIEYKNYSVLIYKALPTSLMTQTELDADEVSKYGWYHHQLLQKTLLWVDEMFIPFLNVIISMRKNAMNTADKQSQTVLYLLKILIEQIEKNNIINGFPLIPDLFTYRSDTNLMSYRERIPRQWIGKDKDGYKYSYMFSQHTSRNFAVALLALLRKRFNDQLFIQSLDVEVTPGEISTKEPAYCLPKNVDARINFLENYYELNSLARTAKLKYSKAQLMFLFKILEQSKIVQDGLPKEQAALAISILTGIPFGQIYTLYPHKSNMNCEKLFDIKNRETLIQRINEISDDAINAIAKGQKNYAFK